MSCILLISPEPWDGHFVSKHHYAMELARRGHDVVFYGPPGSHESMHLERVSLEGASLQVLHAPRVAPGLQHFPSKLRNLVEARWLRRLEHRLGSRVDVIWLFENSRFFDMRFAGNRLRIYHQVDLNQDFHPEAAISTADFAFCTSDSIAAALDSAAKSAGTPLWKIHHGLSSASIGDVTPATLGPGPNATYIGNMSMSYLDHALLSQCVRQFPDVTFHLVGGGGDELKSELGNCPNIRWHGKVPYHRVPELLAGSDLLLVTYRRDAWHHQTSPHKMMEYLASGRAIVATWTDEYRHVPELLEMTDNTSAFLSKISEVISNLNYYNSPAMSARRRAFAFDRTYDKQLDRIVDKLGTRGKILTISSP